MRFQEQSCVIKGMHQTQRAPRLSSTFHVFHFTNEGKWLKYNGCYLSRVLFICRKESQDSSFINFTQQMSNKNNIIKYKNNIIKYKKDSQVTVSCS